MLSISVSIVVYEWEIVPESDYRNYHVAVPECGIFTEKYLKLYKVVDEMENRLPRNVIVNVTSIEYVKR